MIFLLFIVAQVFAAEPVIKSKDDIEFRGPEYFKSYSVGKVSQFRGVIERVYSGSNDLKMVDLYQFKTQAIAVNNKLCSEVVEKIFAIEKSEIFKLKDLKIVESSKGRFCEAIIEDKVKPVKSEDAYYRIATIGFINAKANVLVYHPKSINDDKITEVRQFWNTLR